jgi:predicted benzoate:H+ symporter BenE
LSIEYMYWYGDLLAQILELVAGLFFHNFLGLLAALGHRLLELLALLRMAVRIGS